MIFIFQALSKPVVNNTQACSEKKLENLKNGVKQWHGLSTCGQLLKKLLPQYRSLWTNQYCNHCLNLQKINVWACSETLSVVCTHNASLTCQTWSTNKMAGSQLWSVCWISRLPLKCLAQLILCYGHSMQQLFNMFYQKGCMLCKKVQHTDCSVSCCPTFNFQLSC